MWCLNKRMRWMELVPCKFTIKISFVNDLPIGSFAKSHFDISNFSNFHESKIIQETHYSTCKSLLYDSKWIKIKLFYIIFIFSMVSLKIMLVCIDYLMHFFINFTSKCQFQVPVGDYFFPPFWCSCLNKYQYWLHVFIMSHIGME